MYSLSFPIGAIFMFFGSCPRATGPNELRRARAAVRETGKGEASPQADQRGELREGEVATGCLV